MTLTEYKIFYRRALYAILTLIRGFDKKPYQLFYKSFACHGYLAADFIGYVGDYFFRLCCSPEIKKNYRILAYYSRRDKMKFTFVAEHKKGDKGVKKINLLSCITYFKEKIPFVDNRITLNEFDNYLKTLENYIDG